MVSLHGNGTDPEQAEIERLGLRLARLEALVGKAAVSSQSQGLSRTKSLWADVIQTAGKLGEVITKMGDTVLLHQLGELQRQTIVCMLASTCSAAAHIIHQSLLSKLIPGFLLGR